MSAELHYASPQSMYRQYLRRSAILLLYIAALLCATVWLLRFMQQIQRIREQRRDMNWIEPPRTVIASVGHADDASVLTPPLYHLRTVLYPRVNDPKWLVRYTGQHSVWTFGAWVFLHGRRSGGNDVRLVDVNASPTPPSMSPSGLSCTLYASSWIPATLEIGSRPRPATVQPADRTLLTATKSLRIYAGQPDPADESHFTIEYEVDGKTDTIDGWLMPDDSVKLEPRNK